MSCFNGQNRTLACYTLLCLGTILSESAGAGMEGWTAQPDRILRSKRPSGSGPWNAGLQMNFA